MSNQKYVAGGVWRSVSKPNASAARVDKKEEKKKPLTVLGVEVDKLTHDRYSSRVWNINGREYSLLGVMLWATSKEIATAYPEDSKAARAAFASILDEIETANPEGVADARRKLDNTIMEITGERMMKPVKHINFGGYLEDINAIYKADREQREKIDAELNQAKAKYKELSKTNLAPDDPERTIARGKLFETEGKYRTQIEELTLRHIESVNAVRNEMLEHLTEFYRADPGKLDEKAIQFINSGIATPAELEHLAGQFKANPTMLRMIGQHAKKLKDKYKQHNTAEERKNYVKLMRLSNVADNLTADVNKCNEISIFNGLAAFAERGVTRNEYQAAGFAAKWNDIYTEAVEKMRTVDRLAE